MKFFDLADTLSNITHNLTLLCFGRITEAVNETKDKVKYMDSLRRHIDQLYHGATPQSIMQPALPGLVNNVKQMDSISRYYSRSGFLGIFFTKVQFFTLLGFSLLCGI